MLNHYFQAINSIMLCFWPYNSYVNHKPVLYLICLVFLFYQVSGTLNISFIAYIVFIRPILALYQYITKYNVYYKHNTLPVK